MTDPLERALNELVPLFEDEPLNWSDVVARAHQQQRQPAWSRRKRQRVLVFAVAVLLIALLATPAFGVQQFVLHLLGRRDVSFTTSPAAPNIVKKQFLDLPIGAPTHPLKINAAQTRVVGKFTIGGHPRRLFVAPTAHGGFCFTFELSFGSCWGKTTKAYNVPGLAALSVIVTGPPPKAHVNESLATRVGGIVTARAAARLTARFADNTSADLPFVWVSAPINAGFFTYDVPRAHWNYGHRLVSLDLYAKDGTRLGQQAFRYRAGPARVHRVKPSQIVTPTQRTIPAVAPTPTSPTQRGTADGFTVVVGHNGSVQFTQVGETPILRELEGRSAGFDCARLTREFGIFTVRGFGQSGRFAPKVGFTLNGVGMPADFCEVEASIGRIWPDRLHNRAAVEIPLTPAGQRFFADRQAARDLALFVRSRRGQHLRKETPASTAKRDIVNAYGTVLANSAIRITIISPTRLRFSERSSTGRVFTVLVHDGRITTQNVKPYAFVF